MLNALLMFIGLAAVIAVAGTVLARAADEIAESTGFGRLLIGSVLLAGATSLPELSVDISAIRMGKPDLAVGDLLGSCLMNLLILALLDLTHYSRGRMLSRMAAAHAMSGLLSIGLCGLVCLGLLTTARHADWSFLGVHLWVWLTAGGYVAGVRLVFLDQRIAVRAIADEHRPADQQQTPPPVWKSVACFAAAAIVILLTGPHLAETADRLADLSGLGKTFVGTTFVALTTSLPELVASLAALRLGSIDLAIGNVFGSNAFNLLLLLPLDFLHSGALLASVTPAHAVSAIATMVATSVVLMGQLYHAEKRRPLVEPDAWLVIALILAALGLVYLNGLE